MSDEPICFSFLLLLIFINIGIFHIMKIKHTQKKFETVKIIKENSKISHNFKNYVLMCIFQVFFLLLT